MNTNPLTIGGHYFPDSEGVNDLFFEAYPEFKSRIYQGAMLGFMLARNDLMLHYLNQQQEEIKALSRIIADLTTQIKEYENFETQIHH